MTALINIQNSLLALLKLALDSTYYKLPIPSDVDSKLKDMVSDLARLNRSDLEAILAKISGDNARILGLFAERMASLAVRQNNIELIRDGLFALLIYARTQDPRDVLLVLSLLHDAAIKITGSAHQIFNDVSSLAGGKELLNDFLKRNDTDKSISAMGYEESTADGGFLYVRTW